MTKLSFINKGIVNTSIPELNSAINELSDVISKLSSLNAPSASSVNFNSNINDLNTVLKNLNDLKKWCVDSSIAFGKLESSYTSKGELLPKDVMPLRGNKIKE